MFLALPFRLLFQFIMLLYSLFTPSDYLSFLNQLLLRRHIIDVFN